MMQDMVSESFPIRSVSEMTGVNSVTLRAWERRYGLIKPLRTPKGHRVYTQADIQLIEEILERLSMGTSISQVARDIRNKASVDQGEDSDIWAQYRARMIDAIVDFNDQGLEKVYNDAMSLYPVEIVTSRLIMPLLEELGSRWESKTGNVAEEHFFSVYLRNKLGARFHHQNLKNSGPKLIAACFPGEQHEFGILLFALMAHSRGFRIILLGADLPVDELKHVAQRTGSQGIVLAGSATLKRESVSENIRSLTGQLSIPVFVGGDISLMCRDEIISAGAHALGRDLTAGMHTIAVNLKRN